MILLNYSFVICRFEYEKVYVIFVVHNLCLCSHLTCVLREEESTNDNNG